MFIYFEKERERTQAGERQRKKERKNTSSLHAVSAEPDARFEPTNREIMA